MPLHPMSDADFQAESDMHTLVRAQEIKAAPERVARAKQFAAEKARQMARVAGSIRAPDSGEGALKTGFRKVR